MVESLQQPCWCGTYTVNPDGAQFSIGMDVMCSRLCFNRALEARQSREIEPQGVSGAQGGYAWDVVS
jgi:hypothetical protein